MPVKHLAVEAETANRGTPVRELARTMREQGVGDLIVEENHEPVGIVTDRDVALAVADGDDLDDLAAEDVMTGDPATIEGDAEAVELPKKMAEARVRRMPVVNENGILEGVATLDDVVATAGEQLENAATVIESQSPEYEP